MSILSNAFAGLVALKLLCLVGTLSCPRVSASPLDTVSPEQARAECPWNNIRHLEPDNLLMSTADSLHGGIEQPGRTLMKIWIQQTGRHNTSITLLFGKPREYAQRYHGATPQFEMNVLRINKCLLIVDFPGMHETELPLKKPLPFKSEHISRAYLIRSTKGHLSLHIWFSEQQFFTFRLDEEYSRFRLNARTSPGYTGHSEVRKPYWLLWLYPPDNTGLTEYHISRLQLDEPWIKLFDPEGRPALLNPGRFTLRSTVNFADFHLRRAGENTAIELID